MKSVLLLAGLFMAGCVSSYTPPTNAINPAIKIDTKNINSIVFFEQGRDCSRSRKLEAPHNPYLEGALPLPVRGGQLLAFQLGYANRREACSTTLSFVPKFNHDYVIYNKLREDQRKNISCSFRVIRKHRTAGVTKWQDEETVQMRKPIKAFDLESPHCR